MKPEYEPYAWKLPPRGRAKRRGPLVYVGGGVVRFPLADGRYCLIDETDVPLADEYLWNVFAPCPKYHRHTSYVRANAHRRTTVLLHNLLLGCVGVDHHNGDGLDNRRINLRPATQTQNNANTRLHQHNTSGVKGVRFNKASGKWCAYVHINRRQLHLGSFASREEAIVARERAAWECWGEFAATRDIAA
jgi:hypothetical protein